jgi:Flp pilus assembly protein TadB
MIDPSILITSALELGSRFLKSITRDEKVEEAYKNLVTSLEERDVIPPVLQDQLERYQVESDELLRLLKRYLERSRDTEILAMAQRLLSTVDLAVERTHRADLSRIEAVYNQHLGEQKIWSRFGIVVAFLGFFLIFVGIASIYLVNITVGIVVTVAGIVMNLTSALFFRQASNAAVQANNKYEKLTQLEDIRTSAEVLSSLRSSLNRLAS